MSTESFDARAMVRDAYDRAPIEDADRSDTEETMGREVLVESPSPWPRDARTDDGVKLPLRVVLTCDGVALEIGPYDFSDRDVDVLRQGIDAYDRIAHPELSRESLRDRLMAHTDTSTAERSEGNDILADSEELGAGPTDLADRALAEAKKVLAAREVLRQLEQAQDSQPERLAKARTQADDERIKALTAEPWADS